MTMMTTNRRTRRNRRRGAGLSHSVFFMAGCCCIVIGTFLFGKGEGFVFSTSTKQQKNLLPTRPHNNNNNYNNPNSYLFEANLVTLLAASGGHHHLSEADKDRLLMGEIGMTAFIVSEMEHFVNTTLTEFDNNVRYERKWKLSPEELIEFGYAATNSAADDNNEKDDIVITNQEYLNATKQFQNNGGTLAIELIVNTTRVAFTDGLQQTGLLSALGSAILFFKAYYCETPTLLAACERIGLSDYQIAHHITDMYHHRTFRGTYTKTLPASGKGEIAARIAVGLQQPEDSNNKGDGGNAPASSSSSVDKQNQKTEAAAYEQEHEDDDDDDDDDECLCWSPTTPGVCLHWKSDDEAWRKKRFERIQMEGTRDPRRGGSGTTR